MFEEKLSRKFIVRKYPEDYALIEGFVCMLLDTFAVINRDESLSFHLNSIIEHIEELFPSSECDCSCDAVMVCYGRNVVD